MRNKRAETTTKKLVKLFKEKRLQKGISHQKLADIAGIHRSTVSRVESGERIPTITVCLKIAEAMEEDLADLLKRCLLND